MLQFVLSVCVRYKALNSIPDLHALNVSPGRSLGTRLVVNRMCDYLQYPETGV